MLATSTLLVYVMPAATPQIKSRYYVRKLSEMSGVSGTQTIVPAESVRAQRKSPPIFKKSQ